MKQFGSKNKDKKNTGKSVVKATPTKKPMKMQLFYMTTNDINCKQVLEGIEEQEGMSIDVWESMGIATIEYSANEGIDFEECDVESFDSESDMEFVKQHEIKTIFQVTLVDTLKDKAGKFFQKIIDTNGGFFCTDSDDFEPIFNKGELEQWI